MATILVTGATGFIGRALVPALIAQGHHVRGAARSRPRGATEAEWVTLPDLAQPIDWQPLLAGVDAVVHLAGIAHRSGETADAYARVNAGAVRDLAAACAKAGSHLVFMSSIGAQAGSAADGVVTEDTPMRPVTAYDHAKRDAEVAVRESNCIFTILRPVLVYGPEPKANVALLKRLAKSRWPLPFAAFSNRRSMLAIDNLVSAVLFCLASQTVRDDTFVVCDPEPMTLSQMLTTMREAIGRAPRLIAVPPALFQVGATLTGRRALWDRVGRNLVASSAKLQALGWRPPLQTCDALTQMMRAAD